MTGYVVGTITGISLILNFMLLADFIRAIRAKTAE